MNFHEEPARLIGLIVAAVPAVIALLIAFGVDLTEDQSKAILGVVGVLSPIVAGFWIREKVYSPATMEREADAQYSAGTPPTEPQPDIPPPGGV